MKRFKILIGLEIKKSVKLLPKLTPGAVLMLLTVFVIALGAKGLLNEKKEISEESRIKIGVVCYDDSRMMELAKKVLTSTKSITESINLIFMGEEEAEEMLGKNQLMAVMVIPEDAIRNIISGENTPIEVRFPKNAGYEAAAFKEIGDAAAGMLASAQAGIYSVYDFYKENNRRLYIDDALDRLNERYIKTVLLRENFFDNTSVVATGDLTVMEYYCVSGLVLFLFLFGINGITFMEGYKKETTAALMHSGIGIYKQLAARLIGIVSIYGIFSVIIIAGAAAAEAISIDMAFRLIPALLPVIMSAAALILLVRVCIANKFAAVIAVFFGTVFQGFVTGSFIPEIMLPEAVNSIGRYTPAYYMIKQIKDVYMGNEGIISNTVILLGIAAVSVAVSGGYMKFGRKV